MLTFFVLGGPGSGKGTLCSDLVRDHGFVHLSAGELLRAERDSGSPQGDLINSTILSGKIVPVDITANLLLTAMKNLGWTQKTFLIDGFPRNYDNCEGFERILGPFVNMPFMIFLECTKETMIKRISKRASESTTLRNDDNDQVLIKRFDTFHAETMPVIEKYEKEGKVQYIDANRSAPEVTQTVVNILKEHKYIQ